MCNVYIYVYISYYNILYIDGCIGQYSWTPEMFYDNDSNKASFGMSKFVALYRSFTGLHLGSKPRFHPIPCAPCA